MDLSKLPKLGQSPPPPPQATGDPSAPVPRRVLPAEANRWDLGLDVGLALLLGLIFLYLGFNFGRWAVAQAQGEPFVTGVKWHTAGPPVGKAMDDPVEYFDLGGGTAWAEMGFFVLGAVLLLEALLLGVAMARGSAGRGLFAGCLLLGLAGALANLLAIVMQARMGFTMPLVSLIAVFVGAFTAYTHARRIFDRPALA